MPPPLGAMLLSAVCRLILCFAFFFLSLRAVLAMVQTVGSVHLLCCVSCAMPSSLLGVLVAGAGGNDGQRFSRMDSLDLCGGRRTNETRGCGRGGN